MLQPQTYLFIFRICVFVTQVSGDIIQTPEMAVMDSIIKVKSGFHFIGGGEAYCVGRSKCRTIPLCELTKTRAMVRAIRVLPGYSCAMSFATCTSKELIFRTFFTSFAGTESLESSPHHMYVHVERSKIDPQIVTCCEKTDHLP